MALYRVDGLKQIKQPLRGQVLFVYLKRRVINENKFQRSVEVLGGKIEKFFSKEVTCLLVDDDYGSQGSGLEPSTSPLWMSSTASPYNNENSPLLRSSSLASPINERAPVTVFSRGFLLFQRSKGNGQGNHSTEPKPKQTIIDKAQALGIKIKKISTFLEWLNAEMTKQRLASGRSKVSTGVKNEVTSLLGPAIKVEDMDQKYRPQYKVFTEEPRLFFENGFCETPFDSLPTQQQVLQTKPYSSRITEPKSVVEGRKTKVKPKERRLQFRKPRKTQYCECCKVFFDSLSHHINSSKHLLFVNDKSNYECIQIVLECLPSVQEFLLANHCVDIQQNNHDK